MALVTIIHTAKKHDLESFADCLAILDPLERDKCIIQRLEKRNDERVSDLARSINQIAADLKRDFKFELDKKIDNEVMPVLKSADDNAIGAILAYGNIASTVNKIAVKLDIMESDLNAVKRDMATKDDLKPFATKDDLKPFATKDSVKTLAVKIDGMNNRIESMDKKIDKLLEK